MDTVSGIPKLRERERIKIPAVRVAGQLPARTTFILYFLWSFLEEVNDPQWPKNP
jgi:hypothetical protein